jgi:hypothetical protein
MGVAKAVQRLRKQIRQKHRAYMGEVVEKEEAIERSLRPITTPLKRVLDLANPLYNSNVKSEVSKREIKQDPENEEDDNEELQGFLNSSDISDDSNGDVTPSTKRRRGDSRSLSSSSSLSSIRATPSLNVSTADTSMNTSLGMPLMMALSNLKNGNAENYFHKVLTDPNREIDHTYGVSMDPELNYWKLGDSVIDLDEGAIIVKNKRFLYTPGFFELIFMKAPNNDLITNEDVKRYKEILELTSAHRKRDGSVKTNKGHKYTTIISNLFPPRTGSVSSKRGKGIHFMDLLGDAKIDYRHWNDVNELVDRLRLLVMSKRAGHTGHNNEITAIVEELREAGVIGGRVTIV